MRLSHLTKVCSREYHKCIFDTKSTGLKLGEIATKQIKQVLSVHLSMDNYFIVLDPIFFKSKILGPLFTPKQLLEWFLQSYVLLVACLDVIKRQASSCRFTLILLKNILKLLSQPFGGLPEPLIQEMQKLLMGYYFKIIGHF